MRIETSNFKWGNLTNKIRRSRSGQPKVRGANLTARFGNDERHVIIRHHNTDIAHVKLHGNDGTVRLWIDADGYRSATTKHYLNEVLQAFKTDSGIFQRDFEWYWADGSEYSDGTELWGSI